MTHDFKAPRSLVFETMTKPELLKRRLSGLPGWTIVECENDVNAQSGDQVVSLTLTEQHGEAASYDRLESCRRHCALKG